MPPTPIPALPDPAPLRKGERTRRRILGAALNLFAERGYNAVSLRDVAAAAGMTHVGLKHHFANKDAVLIAVMVERDEDERAALLQALEAHGATADPRPYYLPWLVGRIARNQRHPDVAPLYVKISAEATDPAHPAHDHFVRRYETLRRLLTEAFEYEFARLDPPPTADPAESAGQVLALADGLQLQWVLQPDSTDMVGSLTQYLRSLGIVVEVPDWLDTGDVDDERPGDHDREEAS